MNTNTVSHYQNSLTLNSIDDGFVGKTLMTVNEIGVQQVT